MNSNEYIGPFEQQVLTAIVLLGDQAYGAKIHERVSELAGVRSVNFGSIYVTLDRLERKGYVKSWFEEGKGEPERDYKRGRYFQMKALGERVLNETLSMSTRLAEAVDESGGFGKWKPRRKPA